MTNFGDITVENMVFEGSEHDGNLPFHIRIVPRCLHNNIALIGQNWPSGPTVLCNFLTF